MRPRGIVELAWKVRSALSVTNRKRVRRFADVAMWPLGSINGVAQPSKLVALTFDDGPDPIVTPQLLQLLRTKAVCATFFVLIERVAQYPEILRRMANEGHEIALHSDSHDRLNLVPFRETVRRLAAARRILEGMSGRRVRFFRPPFGAQSLSSYVGARMCGLDVVVWGPHAEDWVESSPEAVAARGLKNLLGGDILLLHDGLEIAAGASLPAFDRVRACELILEGMAARGLTAVTVGHLTSSGPARCTAWFRP